MFIRRVDTYIFSGTSATLKMTISATLATSANERRFIVGTSESRVNYVVDYAYMLGSFY